MLDKNDFQKKQIVFLFVNRGDKLSFRNDNLLVKDRDGKIRLQTTCYRIFICFIIGDTSITTGLIKRAKKFGFTLVLMSQSMKLYSIIGNRMEGNTLLHRLQYEYDQNDLAVLLIRNKVANQREALMRIRKKTPACKEAIDKLDKHLEQLQYGIDDSTVLGIEGSAARVYFPQVFSNTVWNGRKPRVKNDFINTTLDIGYNLLFNIVDSLLQVYGFDVYQGVLHKNFYMRKSLVCDLMEPCRPIIDMEIRKAVNLGQCKEEDFCMLNHQWVLEYKNSKKYVEFLTDAILQYKEQLFLYIQQYYRAFMKEKPIEQFPMLFLERTE